MVQNEILPCNMTIYPKKQIIWLIRFIVLYKTINVIITNIIYMTTSVSWRLNILYIMFKIIAFFMVICESWHFTHMWKTLAWPHNYRKWPIIYLCVGVSILPLSTIFLFDFETRPTEYFLFFILLQKYFCYRTISKLSCGQCLERFTEKQIIKCSSRSCSFIGQIRRQRSIHSW
jgi:hypothetical protein